MDGQINIRQAAKKKYIFIMKLKGKLWNPTVCLQYCHTSLSCQFWIHDQTTTLTFDDLILTHFLIRSRKGKFDQNWRGGDMYLFIHEQFQEISQHVYIEVFCFQVNSPNRYEIQTFNYKLYWFLYYCLCQSGVTPKWVETTQTAAYNSTVRAAMVDFRQARQPNHSRCCNHATCALLPPHYILQNPDKTAVLAVLLLLALFLEEEMIVSFLL